jgi:hypothetical protein
MLSYNSRKSNRVNINFWLALLITVIVMSAAGCARLKTDNSAVSSSGQTNASAPSSSPASVPPSSAGAGKPTSWEENATSLKSADGQTITLACSPAGEPHTVWGSDIYTSDSSICTAAVHSGLITFQQGGTVTIQLRPGRSMYGASERNGVTTNSYGSWQQSFVFKTPNMEAVVRAAEESNSILWNAEATIVPFEAGKTLKFTCPSNGKESNVWGTDTYTIDSSICTAAVHAGKIKLETGGPVTIEMTPGESSYKGSLRNGIKSNDYEKYGASFILK